MENITITEKIKSEYELPAKAIGTWAITVHTDEICTLHILKKDGTLGSDRNSNIYKIPTAILDEILGKPKAPKLSEMPLSPRKRKWIEELFNAFESDPFLSKLLNDKNTLIAKILEDTDANKSKKYSSIESAIRVWNIRIRKGEF